ncbi:MAG: cytochrome c biogenesis protein CcsA [Gemmatimonadota bacterium]|jgi:ABC-type uncharacterized transport system permease subunit|nr:MAG: cytochrome c biogenesis protein CcsA [Gemmatimonadota bacterium]
MILVLHLIALALYLTAWVLQLRGFRQGKALGELEVTAVGAGLGVHAAGILLYALAYRSLPLVGIGPASSSLAFAIGLFVFAASVRSDVRSAGLFLLPPMLLLLGEAILMGIEPAGRQIAFRGPWFVLHVSTVFVGYAGLAAASAASIMYVLQFRTLKRKEFGSVFRFFPALPALDRLNKIGLAVGFPALTIGLIAGWSWTLTFGRGLALEDPGTILGIVTWGAYLVAIVARMRPGPRGERAAVVSVIAFVVTFAAFLALRITAGETGFFL